MRFNKKIHQLKLSITTDCILQCKYCFVNKNRLYMDFNTAKKAVDFFLSAPGKEKILKIYGGEPLLHFSLIKQITPYAIKKAKKEKKILTISPCTNAVLLNSQHIRFFKKNNFKLAISLDGDKKFHNRFRVFSNNSGTFDKIRRNLKFVFNEMESKNFAAALDVTPSTASGLYNNFKYVLSLGFDTVNIETTYGFQTWTKKAQKDFLENLVQIIEHIFHEIKRKNYIFLATINKEIKYKILSNFRKGVCHFFQSLEIYPTGEMAFSNFLLNVANRERYIIGNINDTMMDRYRSCRFSAKSMRCKDCLSKYFDQKDSSLSAIALYIRDMLSIQAANQLKRMAKDSRVFEGYVLEAKKHICF